MRAVLEILFFIALIPFITLFLAVFLLILFAGSLYFLVSFIFGTSIPVTHDGKQIGRIVKGRYEGLL